MKGAFLTLTGVLLLTVLIFHNHPNGASSYNLIPSANAAALQESQDSQGAQNACTPPTRLAATPEQTAWQLFVAATCPVNSGKYPYVVWENWIEQSKLYSPTATALGENAGATEH